MRVVQLLTCASTARTALPCALHGPLLRSRVQQLLLPLQLCDLPLELSLVLAVCAELVASRSEQL
jgi:hypothetical protein